MLEDDQILPACYRYASKYCNRSISFNELVNVGYVNCKKLNNPMKVGMWAKYTIIHYVMKDRIKLKPKARLVSCVLLGESEEEEIYYHKHDDEEDHHKVNIKRFDVIDPTSNELLCACELMESIKDAINKTCNDEEKAIISMRFYQDMKLVAIANVMGIRSQSVFVKIKKILKKLREHYERR